jgi:uncharacterized protein (TIGR02001 family)
MVQRDAVGLEKVRKSLIFKGKPDDFRLARVSLTLKAVSPDRILIRSSIMKKTILALSLAALSVPALAQGKKPEPEYTISGNFGVTSDYRFRGISQTNLNPAVQGGVDIAHKSGLYLGNWNSSVSEWAAPYGSTEMDLYGGYKTELMGIGLDFGAIQYYYPGAQSSQTDTTNLWNTSEAYIGASYGPVSIKASSVLSSRYFGLGKNTTSQTGLANTLSLKGSAYLDLSFAKEVAPRTTVKLHYGTLNLKGSTKWGIVDYSYGIFYDLGEGWTASLVGYNADLSTNAKDSNFFTEFGNTTSKKLYKSGGAIALTKTF